MQRKTLLLKSFLFMFEESQPDFFEDDLKVISNCPLCGARYNPMKADILEENEEAHLIHITCNKCRVSVLAMILHTSMGMSSVGLVTDLTPEDVLKFKNKKDISADDIINFHKKLLKKDSFKELIR